MNMPSTVPSPVHSFPAFNAAAVAALCGPAASQVVIRIVDQTGSTNADLVAALPHLDAPTLLLAGTQTAGRGRAGRSWHCAPGQSLTFSLAWKFHLPMQGLVGLPLAAGVAIAGALAMFGVPVRLKWPNDILFEGRKLAGILIESAPAGSAPHNASWAVIGVGINMMLDAQLAERIGRSAAAIPWLAELDRNVLLATLLNSLAEAMVQFEREGFAVFVERWNALHAYAGQTVVILDNGSILHEGTALGVDNIGRFLLQNAGGMLAVMAGDVSLRLKRE